MIKVGLPNALLRTGVVFWLLWVITLSALAGNPPSLNLQLELDPGTRLLKARAVVVVAPSADFYFELHESLSPSAASVNGQPVQISTTGRANGVRGWQVRLPAQTDTLQLDYSGTLPILDRSLDQRGVLHSLPPMASSAGSFLPAGSAWYPHPADWFTYRVTLSVPGDQRALVPGRLSSEILPSTSAERYQASFDFDQPSDGINLMAGPWQISEKIMPRKAGESVRLRTYFTPELAAISGLAQAYLKDTQAYLERYATLIGDYPFTEFSVVAAPLPTGFGMPTLTYMGANVLKLPFIRATSLGHEVLHNWWGNGVYVDYAQGNWCEGLTTFMADYAYKEQEAGQGARDMRLGWLRDFAAIPTHNQQSLAAFRSRTHGAAAAVGYGKSAMLFGMLRDLIGEEAFERALRSFWQQHRFKMASWSDLRTAFEHASGRPLAAFFDQWLTRTGGPSVRLSGAYTQPEAGKLRLKLELAQSEPPYSLRLPLEVVYSEHSEWHWLDSSQANDSVHLAITQQPEGVRLDPQLRVWRRLEPTQLPPILRQWVVARAPRWASASAVPEVRETGQLLANRFFESTAQSIPAQAIGQGEQPVLLIGLHDEVDAVLAANQLPPRPLGLGTRGSAQVWTVNHAAGAAVAVISGKDAQALQALLRPLPHYAAQSWLVFEGARLLERGIWPAAGTLVATPRRD